MSTRFYPNQVDYIVQLNAMDDATLVANDVASSNTVYPVFSTTGTSAGVLRTATTKISFVPSTGVLTSVQFAGMLSTPDMAVVQLPPANVANRGLRSHVTNSTVPAAGNFGATVVGGGTNVVPVFCTGTAWIIA